MKYSLILLAIFMLFGMITTVVAQDSMKINATYLGVLYTGTYETTNSWNLTNASTVRGGVDGYLPLGNGIEIGFRAGAEMPTNLAFGQAYVAKEFGPAKVKAGYIARPITATMRPMPLTPGGHFEPPSLAAIPGGGTGVMISGKSGSVSVSGGSHYLPTNRTVEWGMSLVVPNPAFVDLKVACYTSPAQTGLAFCAERKGATLTTYVASNGVSALFAEVRTALCAPYFTAHYRSEKMEHQEIGWTKLLSGPQGLRTLIGMGWQYHSKALNVYVQAYL